MGSTYEYASGRKAKSKPFLWIPKQSILSSAMFIFSLQRSCSSESGSTFKKQEFTTSGSKTFSKIHFKVSTVSIMRF